VSLLPTTLCVIPCRMGSKGVARKNMRLVAGRTLLDRAIDFAESVSPHIIVSTESQEVIQHVGVRAMIDFCQPPMYHGDESRAVDVWKHAWLEAEKQAGHFFSTSIYLEPTSPLREVWMAEHAVSAISAMNAYSAAWTVEEVPVRYANMKQFGIAKGVLSAVEGADTALRRQDIPERFIRNGAVYALSRVWMMSVRSAVYSPLSTCPIRTPPLVNIDDEADMAEAERRLTQKEKHHGKEEIEAAPEAGLLT